MKTLLRALPLLLIALFLCHDAADAQRRGGGGGMRGGGMRGGGMRATRGGARTSISSRPRPAQRPVNRPSARPGGDGGGIRNNVRPGGDAGSIRNTDINRRGDIIDNRHINYNPEIDVNGRWGDYDWNDGCCAHPIAAAATVAAAAAVTTAAVNSAAYYYTPWELGTVVYTLPPECSSVMVGAITYQQCGSDWYQPSFYGTEVTYLAVAPPR